jgi:hypothetical protein
VRTSPLANRICLTRELVSLRPYAIYKKIESRYIVDRLGRSLIDLLGTVQALEACGVAVPEDFE